MREVGTTLSRQKIVHRLSKYPLNSPRMTQNMDCRLIQLFCKLKEREDIKKSSKHYLIIIKRYTILQIHKGVAELLGLPRPSELLDSKPHKTVNFKARNFCFWKNAYLFKLYKCYY